MTCMVPDQGSEWLLDQIVTLLRRLGFRAEKSKPGEDEDITRLPKFLVWAAGTPPTFEPQATSRPEAPHSTVTERAVPAIEPQIPGGEGFPRDTYSWKTTLSTLTARIKHQIRSTSWVR